ncbi:MAG: hypothetical protein O2857_03395 [Planctomycetota bacterium]|nr:hypothetical protein [Planctomycetota bacterium]
MKTRYLILFATLVFTYSPVTAEYIPMLVNADEVKVFDGTKVIANLKQSQLVYQTARNGRWIGVHWEDKANGQMKRGWVRNTFLDRAPEQAIQAIGTPTNTPASPNTATLPPAVPGLPTPAPGVPGPVPGVPAPAPGLPAPAPGK